MKISNNKRRQHRHYRMRYNLKGTTEKPRLCVFKSNTNFYCQLIDDSSQSTLANASTVQLLKTEQNLSNKEKVVLVAQNLAKQAKTLKIKTLFFDRSGYLYTGLIKLFADTVRANGLEF